MIDTGQKKVVSTIKVGGSPHGVAVSPDGNSIYVTSTETFESGGKPTLSVYDTAGTLKSTVSFDDPNAYPWSVAASKDRVYVTSIWNGAVYSVNVTKNNAVTRIDMFEGPQAVAVAPNGKAYVATGAGTVEVITGDARTGTLNVGVMPMGLVNGPSGTVLLIEASGMSLTTINSANDTFRSDKVNTSVFPGLPDSAFSPDFSTLYTPVYDQNEVWAIPAAMFGSSPSQSA